MSNCSDQQNQAKVHWELVDQLRQQRPIVLTVANTVTVGKVADAVSAVGASPIMSEAPAEAAEMDAIANAITINLGTITTSQLQEIHAILDSNELKRPVVVDPVAVGSIKYRLGIAQDLFDRYHFTAIRGNAGEIAALAGVDWQSHGIDAGQGNQDLVPIAKKCANKYHCVTVLTGPVDIITDGKRVVTNSLSTNSFTVNIGSGDMLSSVVASYLAIADDPFDGAVVAAKAFSVAGVLAAKQDPGLGTWQDRFFDQLSQLSTSSAQNFNREE